MEVFDALSAQNICISANVLARLCKFALVKRVAFTSMHARMHMSIGLSDSSSSFPTETSVMKCRADNLHCRMS